jgi:peptide/nickel transport system permease protein
MLKMLLSRLATAVPSLIGVVIVTFMLTRSSSSPISATFCTAISAAP